MNIVDFKLLKKLMNMTQSGADAERLKAVDEANKIVTRSNTTWDRILDRVIKVEVAVESFEAATGKDASTRRLEKDAVRKNINEAFEVVIASDPKDSRADFISSLKSQWDTRGSLSGAQVSALLKIKDNVEAGR